MNCPNCFEENPLSGQFCSQCGTQLATLFPPAWFGLFTARPDGAWQLLSEPATSIADVRVIYMVQVNQGIIAADACCFIGYVGHLAIPSSTGPRPLAVLYWHLLVPVSWVSHAVPRPAKQIVAWPTCAAA